jgi:hypothetical protein
MYHSLVLTRKQTRTLRLTVVDLALRWGHMIMVTPPITDQYVVHGDPNRAPLSEF